MTLVDYLIIAFYFAFMLALGFVYKHFSRTSSDYFRGGGGMIWPMVGISTFVMQFTAWSFTGGAGKAYDTGVFFLILFACNLVGWTVTVLITAPWFRQMRIITGVEGVRKRFDAVNEQFFTWLPVPFFVIFGGIGLYAISIFVSAVFGMDIGMTILAIGITVTVMSILGGSWAVAASNFIQLLTILSVVLVLAVLSLRHPDVGGLGNLLSSLPETHLNPAVDVRLSVLIPFIFCLALSQILALNNMTHGAAGFVFVKNGRDARKAAAMSFIGSFFMPLLWAIPALASVLIFDNLGADFPQLKNPSEAAYAAMAMKVLPPGLLGLLVCAIFAATMSSMDAGLNRSAGIITRNFYLPIVNPGASEERQLRVGKTLTGLLGGLMILTGTYFSTLQSMPLFDLILIASAAVGIPVATPLFLCLFFRKVPPWAGWSTALAGFAASLVLHFWMSPENLQSLYGGEPLSPRELGELRITLTNGVLIGVSAAWFFITMFFYRFSKVRYQEHVEQFFAEMHRPIDMRVEHIPNYDNDRRQYNTLGLSCVVYGGILALFALAPNSWTGRLGILFCGGFIALVGLLFWWIGHRLRFADWEKDNPHSPAATTATRDNLS